MKIDIDHLCKLSRLSIDEDKKELFANQMSDIVDMVAKIPAIEDEISFLDEKNPMELREDVINTSLTREAVLANAPDKQAGCIVVPKIIESED